MSTTPPEHPSTDPSAHVPSRNPLTATPGRLAAVILGTITTLTVLGLIAVVAAVAGARHFGSNERNAWSQHDEMMQGQGLDRGEDQGWERGDGNGFGEESGNGQGGGTDMGGQGRHQANEGLPALPGMPGMSDGTGSATGFGIGGVLHGEITILQGGTPTSLLVQLGEVTKVTANQSVTVKSSDGFAATYALTADTAYPMNGASALTVGSQVRVIATKDGAKATRIAVVTANQ